MYMPQNHPDRIKHNGNEWQIEEHEEQFREMQNMWHADPSISYREMEAQGNWSRAQYRRLYKLYGDAADDQPVGNVDTEEEMNLYRTGIKLAIENQDMDEETLIRRVARGIQDGRDIVQSQEEQREQLTA